MTGSSRACDVIRIDEQEQGFLKRTGRYQHVAVGDGWCWFESAGASTGCTKQDLRTSMATTLCGPQHNASLIAWLGNFASDANRRSNGFARELRARAARHNSAPTPCGPDFYGGQTEGKALALSTKKNVFVITKGNPNALKLTPHACPPASIQVAVADMGPDDAGDARVLPTDVVLFWNGTNHYNAFLSSE